MKNKKGFISITVVYSFFLVFLMMLVSITASYVNNRMLLKVIKKDVKEEIISNTVVNGSFADYLKSNSSSLGLINHSSKNSAQDNSIRYSGVNPNNYVCFASTEKICPNEFLYRIIGVFGGKVKLIKKTGIGYMGWNDKITNDWINSSLNNYLNNNFLNSLTPFWSEQISNTSWQVGGINNTINKNTAKNIYNYELGNNKININHVSKIGLLYLSDYAYAVNPNYWDSFLSYSTNNWLYLRNNEWTISKGNSNNESAWYILSNGEINSVSTNNQYYVRPVFYLKQEVKKVSGDGTISHPYRIK